VDGRGYNDYLVTISGGICVEFYLRVHLRIDVCNPVKCVIVFGLLVTVVSQEGSWQLSWLRNFYIPRVGGDRLCGLVVRVLGYRSGGSGSIPGTTREKKE
jgi:hypothetical protein